jgi:hypothetical protein
VLDRDLNALLAFTKNFRKVSIPLIRRDFSRGGLFSHQPPSRYEFFRWRSARPGSVNRIALDNGCPLQMRFDIFDGQ